MLTPRSTTTNNLPTKSFSRSDAVVRNLVQISMVKIVEAELKTEVKEDMMAAIITAKIKPFNPVGSKSRTRSTKAISVQPDSDPQILLHWAGSEHPISFL